MIRKFLHHRRQTLGAAVALAIRVVSAVIGFLSQILLARWLGASSFGVLTALLVWVNVLGTVSTLGFATSVLRFLPHYIAQHALPLARGFHRTGMLVALLAGAAIGGLGIVGLIATAISSLLLWNRNSASFGVIVAPAFSEVLSR